MCVLERETETKKERAFEYVSLRERQKKRNSVFEYLSQRVREYVCIFVCVCQRVYMCERVREWASV